MKKHSSRQRKKGTCASYLTAGGRFRPLSRAPVSLMFDSSSFSRM